MLNIILATTLMTMAVLPAEAASYEWKMRVVLICADAADNPSLADQEQRLLSRKAELAERDMVVLRVLDDGRVEALHGRAPTADEARRLWRGHARKAPFAVLLIGKDGGVKRRDTTPVDADALFALVDTMPMRRQEQRR